MKFNKILFAIIISLLIAMPLSADDFKLKSILPDTMEARGWKAEEEPFVAIDEESLSMVINGAAPQYYELGTERAGFANYEKGDAFLMLEIYETDTKKSARKLFELFKMIKGINNAIIINQPKYFGKKNDKLNKIVDSKVINNKF